MGFLSSLFFGGGAESNEILACLDEGALVIDVRTASEFSEGHIQGSIHIPYDVIVREIGKYEPEKNRPVVVYCRSGARSSVAKRSLRNAGYTRVENGGSFRKMKKLFRSKYEAKRVD